MPLIWAAQFITLLSTRSFVSKYITRTYRSFPNYRNRRYITNTICIVTSPGGTPISTPELTWLAFEAEVGPSRVIDGVTWSVSHLGMSSSSWHLQDMWFSTLMFLKVKRLSRSFRPKIRWPSWVTSGLQL